MDYNSTFPTISVHKLYKSFILFLCIFSPSKKSMSILRKNIHKNRAKTRPVFKITLFYSQNNAFKTLFSQATITLLQKVLQILLLKSFLFPITALHSGLIHCVAPE